MAGITGIDRLRKDADFLRKVLGDVVGREVADSLNQPVDKFHRGVTSAIQTSFPRRYAAVFGNSFRLKVSSTVGSSAVRVKLVGTARGKRSIRDSAALNRGVLRHKTWGKLPWHSQSVRPGFWDKPAEALSVDVRDAVEKAMERVALTVEGQL